MLGALVAGAIAAQAARGATLAALSASGERTSAERGVQRRRDGQTLKYFTSRAVAELGVDELDARTGLAIALGSIPTVLARWRRLPTPEHAAHLEATFVTMALGGLHELARDGRASTVTLARAT
jgi:hypothetical protein